MSRTKVTDIDIVNTLQKYVLNHIDTLPKQDAEDIQQDLILKYYEYKSLHPSWPHVRIQSYVYSYFKRTLKDKYLTQANCMDSIEQHKDTSDVCYDGKLDVTEDKIFAASLLSLVDSIQASQRSKDIFYTFCDIQNMFVVSRKYHITPSAVSSHVNIIRRKLRRKLSATKQLSKYEMDELFDGYANANYWRDLRLHTDCPESKSVKQISRPKKVSKTVVEINAIQMFIKSHSPLVSFDHNADAEYLYALAKEANLSLVIATYAMMSNLCEQYRDAKYIKYPNAIGLIIDGVLMTYVY